MEKYPQTQISRTEGWAQVALKSAILLASPLNFPTKGVGGGCSTVSLRKLLSGSGGKWLYCSLECGLTGHDQSGSDFILQCPGFHLSSVLHVLSGQGWDTLLCTNHVMSCMPGELHTSLGEIYTQEGGRETPFSQLLRKLNRPWQSPRTEVRAEGPLQAVWSWRLSHLGKIKEGTIWQPCVVWSSLLQPLLENQIISKEA